MSDTPAIVAVCPVCRWPGGGPSDHEAWCKLFMVGAVAIEGQVSIFDLLEPEPDAAI